MNSKDDTISPVATRTLNLVQPYKPICHTISRRTELCLCADARQNCTHYVDAQPNISRNSPGILGSFRIRQYPGGKTSDEASPSSSTNAINTAIVISIPRNDVTCSQSGHQGS